jgi:hypothetical protein
VPVSPLGPATDLTGHLTHDALQVVERRELDDDPALAAAEVHLDRVSKWSDRRPAMSCSRGATGVGTRGRRAGAPSGSPPSATISSVAGPTSLRHDAGGQPILRLGALQAQEGRACPR